MARQITRVVCGRCGYAYYGKTAPRCGKNRSKGELRYYQCIGTDGHRFGGSAVCDNRQVRGDYLEEIVWGQVRALLKHPERITQEYRRRIGDAQDGAAPPDEITRLTVRSPP
jgi:site-specific DNA recombinase